MAGAGKTKLRISGSKEDAVAAIRDALPKDAIVRDEDDGVGRFAGDRTVMITADGGDRLMLVQGNWRLVKARDGNPQVDVVLKEKGDKVTATVTVAPPEKPSLGSKVFGLLGNIATVAVAAVAYHMYREIEIDNTTVAAIAVGGGIAWTGLAQLWPGRADAGLEDLVRNALAGVGRDDDKDEDEDEDDESDGEGDDQAKSGDS